MSARDGYSGIGSRGDSGRACQGARPQGRGGVRRRRHPPQPPRRTRPAERLRPLPRHFRRGGRVQRAFKIPNFLQNLLGEGVLAASFIPVYAALRAKGEDDQARKVAGAVAGLLTLVTAFFALVGIAATPWLLDLIAPGFSGETRALAIELVRIFFPGISLLVLSAFCIGVLNSHHKFFLSYAAPVVWSAAIIVALILGRHNPQGTIAVWAAWGAV